MVPYLLAYLAGVLTVCIVLPILSYGVARAEPNGDYDE